MSMKRMTKAQIVLLSRREEVITLFRKASRRLIREIKSGKGDHLLPSLKVMLTPKFTPMYRITRQEFERGEKPKKVMVQIR